MPTPKAAKITKEFELHGDKRTDDYYWLNERENPEVIAYLKAENAYYDTLTAHTKDFQSALFEEMKARIRKMTKVFLTRKMVIITLQNLL